VLKDFETYQAIFRGSMAEFWSRVSDIDTYAEVVVSPEDDVELRSISVTNRSLRKRMCLGAPDQVDRCYFSAR
jgi:hypothetical protein